MKEKRKKTNAIFIGSVKIGDGAPVTVQSMTSTDTRDVASTAAQINRMQEAGCEIVRVAVVDMKAADAVSEIQQRINIPLIADIHFDYRLALRVLERGADAIRINPGNIDREHLLAVIRTARDRDIPIRIGINSGSLEKDILARHGGPTSSALVESALRNAAFFEEQDFHLIKLSLKSSHVPTMIDAYRQISKRTEHPLHLGVTEAGGLLHSAIKSSIGLGVLLHEGIGDTIRVSVTGDPVQEIPVAYGILRALDIRKVGPDIISCPTCGRCEIDLPALAAKVEDRLDGMKNYMKIALMGCVVNGPGEAAEADIGIAGGRHSGVLFKKGKVIRKIQENEFVDVLMDEIHAMVMQSEKKED
ncbi:MAG: flavodoxin-dependent (E)-4-hydroxy-3-methylbut-2-enyl-diphosphate synthase [Syntrophales bacterium]|jgi:(E)-4-hydroxy-3-methylbut-2-enyl-diphosphate synthase|nr:flavodoxin-dependent (E)-4-hydroxy-3-methylbut-2-enyl-diphosphate synthase [Syntrophales bacterium]MDY0044004.1 flavodoxin-dependent (E)-4-hydroxy-3-methylbut-2-enyl-diphosphate synthase [Syntrophales bacterium]